MNVKAISVRSHSIATAWFVCVAGAFFFFYEYMQMTMFNAIDQPLRDAFAINATQLGNVGAYYAFANLLFLFPAGLWLDRFSTRKIILTALSICIASTYGFAFAHSLAIIKLCRFMTGVGGSFSVISCIRLASRWFLPKHMALITGVMVTIGMLGGAMAQTPLTLLTEHLGWRNALLIDASFGMLLLLLIGYVVQDYPQQQTPAYAEGQATLAELGFLRCITLAFSNTQNWLGGIYTSLMNLPLAVLGAIWGGPYLQNVRGLTLDQASMVTSMIFIGTIVGAPTVGWISDKVSQRRLPMLIGAALSLILTLYLLYADNLTFQNLLLLFFSLGFITSTQVISYPLISESNPRYLTATSMSLASFLILIAYALFQPLFGWIMDSNWHGQLLNGLRVYTAVDYHLAMLIFPFSFIASFIVAFLIRETHCCAVD